MFGNKHNCRLDTCLYIIEREREPIRGHCWGHVIDNDQSEACVRVSFLNLVKDQIWLKRALKAWYFWFSLKDFTINRLKSYIYYETVLLIELPENRIEEGTRCFTAAASVGFLTSDSAASHGTCIPHFDDWSLGSPALSALTNQRPVFRWHDPYQPIRSLLVFSILP